MYKKIIAWQNWNVAEQDIEDKAESDIKKSINKMVSMENGVEFSEDEEYFDDEDIHLIDRAVITPFGMFSKSYPFKPTDMWNCYMGHTNFPITETQFDIINKTTGVEAFKLLTPYMFCIGISKLCDVDNVRKYIKHMICNYYVTDLSYLKLRSDKIDLITKISDNLALYSYWSIILKNNKTEVIKSNNVLDFTQKIYDLKTIKGKHLIINKK